MNVVPQHAIRHSLKACDLDLVLIFDGDPWGLVRHYSCVTGYWLWVTKYSNMKLASDLGHESEESVSKILLIGLSVLCHWWHILLDQRSFYWIRELGKSAVCTNVRVAILASLELNLVFKLVKSVWFW